MGKTAGRARFARIGIAVAVLVALAIGLWVAIVRSRPLFPQGPTSEVAPTPGVA